MKLINAPVYRGVGLQHIKQNVYGIEIELENYKGRWWWDIDCNGSELWTLVEDPSLRQGIELVSVKMTQVKAKVALKAAQLAINHMKLTSASRCGIHIHVNMLNLSWGQMWSFMALYTFMEPEIFAKFAPERHDNHFCVPMAWNTKMAQDLGNDIDMLRSFNVGDIDYDQKTKGGWGKPGSKKLNVVHHEFDHSSAAQLAGQVAGMNMGQISDAPDHGPGETFNVEAPDPPMYTGGNNKRWYPLKQYIRSLGRYKYGAMTGYRMPDLGTIEIRLLPGTTDMKKIENWLGLLARIKHMAYKFPEPLTLQKYYERHGPEYVWRILNMGRLPSVTPQTKDEAEECAYKIIGNKPMDKSDFDWSI